MWAHAPESSSLSACAPLSILLLLYLCLRSSLYTPTPLSLSALLYIYSYFSLYVCAPLYILLLLYLCLRSSLYVFSSFWVLVVNGATWLDGGTSSTHHFSTTSLPHLNQHISTGAQTTSLLLSICQRPSPLYMWSTHLYSSLYVEHTPLLNHFSTNTSQAHLKQDISSGAETTSQPQP
jgi:hypothetical protein